MLRAFLMLWREYGEGAEGNDLVQLWRIEREGDFEGRVVLLGGNV
jgi:hypothetical protein